MIVSMITANKAICRTRHIILSFEELKYQLNGAQHYSKFHIKHGYIQIELDKSRTTTTNTKKSKAI